MPAPETTLKARYVFPVDGPVIADGCVRFAGDRITWVGVADGPFDLDLGNAAITPGFVNAHTHLELSGVRARDVAARSFAEWLLRVIESRRNQNPAALAHAVERGIDSSIAAGTSLVGDITTAGQSWKLLVRSPLRAVVFSELLGLHSSRAIEVTRATRPFLEWTRVGEPVAATTANEVAPFELADGSLLDPPLQHAAHSPARQLTPSLSPHAPYSTDPALFEWAASWARHARVPLATHLAETPEELRFVERRDGPLREFLNTIGAWNDAWKPPGSRPADYLSGPAAREVDWLIAHGNYFSDAEIAALATGENVRRAIAFCPRTHAYFSHRNHPYRRMLAAGLTVCLGTDSLASVPTLSVLDEMRFLFRRDKDLGGSTILEMGTLAGATALGRRETCGSITPGKFADFAVVRLPDRSESDPYRLLFDSTEPVARTMIGGRFVFQLRR